MRHLGEGAPVQSRRVGAVRTQAATPGASPCMADRAAPWAVQPVLTIRDRVDAPLVPAFIREALGEIRGHMHGHQADPAGPPFANCSPRRHGLVEVETGWPLDCEVSVSGRIHRGNLPRAAAEAGGGPSSSTASRSEPTIREATTLAAWCELAGFCPRASEAAAA